MRARQVGLIALCGALAYHGALGNPFAFDDEYAVQGNALLEDGPGLVHLLTRPGLTPGPVLSGHYRPLAMLTLWLERRAFGIEPFGYRAVNLGLHVLCAVLAGAFVRRLLARIEPQLPPAHAERITLLTALLFCLTPLCSEAVQQVFKLTSSLTTACMLGALIAFDRAFALVTGRVTRPSRPAGKAVGAPPSRGSLRRLRSVCAALTAPAGALPPSRHWMALSLALGALALLAKESAAVMPALVALYGIRGGLFRGRLRLGAGLCLAYAAAPIALLAWASPWGAAAGGEHAGPRHLLAQPAAFLDYAAMLVLPSRVPIVMGLEPSAWPPSAGAVLALGALAGVVVWALWACATGRAPLASFAVLFGAISVAPTSTLLPMKLLADPIHVYMAVVPTLACIARALSALHARIAAWVPDSLARARPLLAALPASALLLHSGLGTRQVGLRYADPALAWLHAARLYPAGRLTTANACITDREPARALATCRRALELDPGNPYVAVRLVGLLGADRRFDEAEAALAAIAARPAEGSPWPLDLAEARLALLRGQHERAHDAFQRLLLRNPGQIEARVFLADLRLRLGRPGAAELIAGLPSAPDPITHALLESVRGRLRTGREAPSAAPSSAGRDAPNPHKPAP